MYKLRYLLTAEGLWSLTILVRENMGSLFAIILGGGGMTYLVFITEWVNQYGPIAWGLAFFAGAYLALGLIYAWAMIASKNFINKQAEYSLSRHGINPKSTRFERQVIHLVDFYSPYYIAHKSKDFIDCDLVGPSMLYLKGGTVSGTQTRHCQIIIADPEKTHWGVTAFDECRILNGIMANVTLVMTLEDYNNLDPLIRDTIPVMHNLST